MIASSKSPADEVATRVSRDYTLQLREVIWIHFVVFHEVSCYLMVFLVGQVSDHLNFELRLAVKQQFG